MDRRSQASHTRRQAMEEIKQLNEVSDADVPNAIQLLT